MYTIHTISLYAHCCMYNVSYVSALICSVFFFCSCIADPKTHIFLGRAFVDLVPLQYGLRSLVGWYSIMNLAGELQGELKVHNLL